MKTNIKIEHLSVDELNPAEYNPRKWNKEALNRLKTSISRFGLVDPIIVNSAPKRKNIVIGGHMRLKAAKELGFKTVPIVYLDIPNEEKEKELNLRLNSNTGEWDFEKLKLFEPEFLLDIGFNDIDLANIWDDTVQAEDDNFSVEDELAKIKVPQTKLGDLIELGPHKIICGDSQDPAVLKRLFGDERASMINSDPPYNRKVDYTHGLGGKRNFGGHVKDDRTDKEYEEFLRKTMGAALTVAQEDSHWFYYCSQVYVWQIQVLYRELGMDNKSICIWAKNAANIVPSIAFSRSYEPVCYATRGKPYLAKKVTTLTEFMNKEVGTGNSSFDDLRDIWMVKRMPGKEMEHATSKPSSLHHKSILRCTRPGEIILDSFSGSASTLIAGEQLKRRVFAVELEPIFCDLAIKRYEALTGKKAKVTSL